MSQFFVGTTAGSLPPTVPTTFQTINGITPDGAAIPAGNIINFAAIESTVNNENGLSVAGSGSTVTYAFTNRATGLLTTSGATPTAVITLPLGIIAGTYTFDITIAGFATSGVSAPLGCGYTIVGAVRTTGAAAILLPTQQVDHFEEGALGIFPQAQASLTVSGNNAIVMVTGVAGYTIDWNALLTYTLAT